MTAQHQTEEDRAKLEHAGRKLHQYRKEKKKLQEQAAEAEKRASQQAKAVVEVCILLISSFSFAPNETDLIFLSKKNEARAAKKMKMLTEVLTSCPLRCSELRL